MNNIIDVLELKEIVTEAGFDPNGNFENLYSQLHSTNSHSETLQKIEQRVTDYFSELELPNYPTLYDLLLLSLREKDAIFTFNWDPFLADAYARLHGIVPLPHVFHLHGNVRVSFCQQCGLSMPKADNCQSCGNDLTPTPLLYPIEQKDYASDPFIASQWEQAHNVIRRAVIITIFGYSAPTSDKEAMDIFTEAWKDDGSFSPIERVEIIDIRDSSELSKQWQDFAHYDHIDVRRSFYDSLLTRYPRRTCEALAHMGINGEFVEPIAWAGNLDGLYESVEKLVAHES